MPLDFTLPFQQQGLLGEQTVDNTVWITKTHYPQDSQKISAFDADKIILLTRYPVDVLPSMASLFLMLSHSAEPIRPWNEYRFWPTFFNEMIRLFEQFHRMIVEQSKVTPTFFITYEQLILDQESVISQLFCFLLEIKTIEGTLLQAQIKKICNRSHS